MFAAIYDLDGAPAKLRQALGSDVRILGKGRRCALIVGSQIVPAEERETWSLEELDGRFWFAGRMRLDARRELASRLGVPPGESRAVRSDARLCLQAYAMWSEGFAEHLAGDFSFVLWDEVRQCLLAVRDQLGVRPLFQARAGTAWLVSDSLDWIAGNSGGGGLDDYWIADFLTLGFSREGPRTVHAGVQRVVPAHLLKLADGEASLRRYWRPGVAEPLHLPNRRDYGVRFRELLSLSIADRLPSSGRVGISMSGGVDSTALAACAVSVAGSPARVYAECEHYAELMHIREDYFASLAARHLGIDLRVRVFDELAYDPHWRERGIRWAEPTRSIINAHHLQAIASEQAAIAPVWFEGEGPDNALQLDRDAYFSWLVAKRRWFRLAGALLSYALVKGPAGWSASWRRHTVGKQPSFPYARPPSWLNRELVDRLRLVERDRDLGEGGDRSHRWHPDAVASFTSPIWQSAFDDWDFQESLAATTWRHPFLDLRVLQFMLAVPPVPWAWNKQLMRDAMAGRLPWELLSREKTPLPVRPSEILVRRHGAPALRRTSDLARYVDLQALPTVNGDGFELYRSLSIHALDYWLQTEAH